MSATATSEESVHQRQHVRMGDEDESVQEKEIFFERAQHVDQVGVGRQDHSGVIEYDGPHQNQPFVSSLSLPTSTTSSTPSGIGVDFEENGFTLTRSGGLARKSELTRSNRCATLSNNCGCKRPRTSTKEGWLKEFS